MGPDALASASSCQVRSEREQQAPEEHSREALNARLSPAVLGPALNETTPSFALFSCFRAQFRSLR